MSNAAQTIQSDFREKVSREIGVVSEGMNRYRVFTPFTFDDGDGYSIVLIKHGNGWYLSDEGHTYMHLSYDMDERELRRGNRLEIIAGVESMFGLEDKDGELIIHVEDERFGDALFDFLQALTKISDVTYLSRERVRSTFVEDFRALITSAVPKERREFGWHHPELDPPAHYPADVRINVRERPVYIYAIDGNTKAQEATIALLTYEKWGIGGESIGVFENQESIGRKVLARFTDVVDKQFSTLHSNADRITAYMQKALAA